MLRSRVLFAHSPHDRGEMTGGDQSSERFRSQRASWRIRFDQNSPGRSRKSQSLSRKYLFSVQILLIILCQTLRSCCPRQPPDSDGRKKVITLSRETTTKRRNGEFQEKAYPIGGAYFTQRRSDFRAFRKQFLHTKFATPGACYFWKRPCLDTVPADATQFPVV